MARARHLRDRFPDLARLYHSIIDRERLAVGWRVAGPAIIEEAGGTTVAPPGWTVGSSSHRGSASR